MTVGIKMYLLAVNCHHYRVIDTSLKGIEVFFKWLWVGEWQT